MVLRRFFLVLALALVAGPQFCARAIELGDTREEIEARYDTAPLGNHQKGTATYRWDVWRLDIQYTGDVALSLVYTKIDPVLDVEIENILGQNGGAAWHVTGLAQGRATQWARTDGATAAFDATKRTLSLHGGRLPAATASAATRAAATPAQPQAKAIAPALKKTETAATATPAKSTEAGAPRATPVPFHPQPSMIGVAVHQKVVWFGVALIVAAIVISKRGSKPGPESNRQQAQPPPRFPQGRPMRAAPPRPPALELVPSLETIGWQRFELLMGEVFRRKGYEVEVSPADGADGGVDLRLRKDGALVLAQCKCYLSGKVSVGVIREFYGVIAHERAARGIFVNTSVYTPDALKFAEGKEMELLDGDGVRELINSVTRPSENIYDVQGWMTEFTANAVIRQPECQFCHKPMVMRTSGEGKSFWGCTGFPQCSGTRDVRADLMKELLPQG